MCCVDFDIVCFVMLGNSRDVLAKKPVQDSSKCNPVEIWEVVACFALLRVFSEHSGEEWRFQEDGFMNEDAMVSFAAILCR